MLKSNENARHNAIEKILMDIRDFIKARKKIVFGSIIVLLIVIAGMVSFGVYTDYREHKDVIAYEKIMEEFIQQQKDEAQKEKAFEQATHKLINLIDSSFWGYIHDKGYYIVAGLYYNEKQYENAKKYYLQFAEDASSVFVQMALSKAALCSEQLGQYDKALEIYKQLEKEYPESPFHDQVVYDLGRMYQKKGDLVKAKEYFNTIATDAKSGIAKRAQKRLFFIARDTK